MEKVDIKSMTLPKLEDFCTGQGLAKFRAGQIFQWIHQKQANSFEQMTNLPADLRKKLDQTCEIPGISIILIPFLCGLSNDILYFMKCKNLETVYHKVVC